MFDNTSGDSFCGYVVKCPLNAKEHSKGERVVYNGSLNLINNPRRGNVARVIWSKGLLIVMQAKVLKTCLLACQSISFSKALNC
jgi:hypothetical protein